MKQYINKNDDIQNLALPSLLETFYETLEKAVKLSLYPIITKDETFEHEKS